MSNVARVIVGLMLSPLAAALLLSLPAAFAPGFFLQAFLWNAGVWYTLFVVCGSISHLILKLRRATRLRDYARVMFWVGTVTLTIGRLAMLQWVFGNGGEEFHLGTQVFYEGHLTLGGFALTVFESMVGSIVLVLIFALFWRIAVKTPAPNPRGA